MSRGFVKEEDQEEAPFIPPRAALPVGVINYVTPAGYKFLLKERKDLEDALNSIDIKDEKEKRHISAVLNGKLDLLNERISSARKIEPSGQTKDEVRFGATVTYKILKGRQQDEQRQFQLVGVDEANIKQKKISFTAPIAKALTGRKVGEVAEFSLGPEKQELRILKIEY